VLKVRNNARRFTVVYQQDDFDSGSALVQRVWVDGGRGADGVDYPGCWDVNRGLAEVPAGLSPPVFSILTADPSPSKFWAIQWWLYHPDTEQRFLMDSIRQAMDAPDFLDWNQNLGAFTGILEEWWRRSVDLGVPITTAIFESNAAARFVLQYEHVKRWQALRGVGVVPHETHRNKSDPNFGVQTIAPHYQFGRVRLPGKQHADMGRVVSMRLVDEVCRWPEGSTDDQVMAHWFLEWNLPRLAFVDRSEDMGRRPSWFRAAASA
jgi:hypothetical protein